MILCVISTRSQTDTNLRVILKCNGAYIYVKLISEIARLRGVVSLSCEERREGGGSYQSTERGGGHKREPREGGRYLRRRHRSSTAGRAAGGGAVRFCILRYIRVHRLWIVPGVTGLIARARCYFSTIILL